MVYTNEQLSFIQSALNVDNVSYAKILKVTGKTLQGLLKGSKEPTLIVYESLFYKLGINPIWFFKGTGGMFTKDDRSNKYQSLIEEFAARLGIHYTAKATVTSTELTPDPRPSGALTSPTAPVDATPELSHYDAVRLENLILLGEMVSKAKASLTTGLNLTAGQLQAIAGYTLAKAGTGKIKASITMETGTLITPLTLTNNTRNHEQSSK